MYCRQNAGTAEHVALDDHAWFETSMALQQILPKGRFSSVSAFIAPMRMIKDADKIAVMRRAART